MLHLVNLFQSSEERKEKYHDLRDNGFSRSESTIMRDWPWKLVVSFITARLNRIASGDIPSGQESCFKPFNSNYSKQRKSTYSYETIKR